ncbi:MAG: lectin-like domain-containing protein [Cytophagaceae bacterium]
MKNLLPFVLLLLAFSAKGQFQLNGAAVNSGGGTYQLTPASVNQFGALWYKLQHNLNNPFNVQGQINLGSDPNGADGITFVMQNGCLAAGGSGGGLGYSGLPGQSIGVEFDTYQNISGTGSELNNDPVYDHIAVEKNGYVVHDGSANTITAPVQMDAVLSNVKTGAWYDFQINYNPGSKLLQVYFNGTLRISVTYDIKANVFSGNPWVYWGFTSSTGGHFNVQQIAIDAVKSTHLLTDTTICTGSIPIVLDPLTNLRGTNLALNNPVVASTAGQPAAWAVDGNLGSRWESAFSDPQWIYVDLQSPTDIDSVTLDWEPAYASGYQIQTSTDASAWTTVFSTTTGDGGHDKIVFSATNIRYIRMYGTVRATPYGYSLWEFGVYGQPKYLWSTNNGTNATISPNIYSSSVTLSPALTTTYSVMIPDACLGFTSYNMTVTVNCITTPVTLGDFRATAEVEGAQLQWTTLSEENTNYFEILKSEDGINFRIIGYLPAAGNSHNPVSYEYKDEESLSGVSYYKVSTVDKDGGQSQSVVRSVEHQKTTVFIPEPLFEQETALVFSGKINQLEYFIVDMLGREIFHAEIPNPSGKVMLGENLPPECYLVRVKVDSDIRTLKICKVR